MKLVACQFEFIFPRPALVMGILNLTPDSFSDGGQFEDSEAAVERAFEMVEQGAEIIDIGGESSRPGAAPVEEAEELRRVMPVIQRLAGRLKVPLSIDTTKVAVARAALDAGASIVNDVGADREDDGPWRLVAEKRAGYVCMHKQGSPQTMQAQPHYGDLVTEVLAFLSDRLERLKRCGVSANQVIVDPGIGFGKRLEHNLQLLGAVGRLVELGRPVLLGMSRKSFIGNLLGTPLAERMPAGLACACLAVQAGGHLIRTHDVAETFQAIRMAEAIIKHR